MKKAAWIAAAVAMMNTPYAGAAIITGNVGKEFTVLALQGSDYMAGLQIDADWLHAKHAGHQLGLRVGYGFQAGPFVVTPMIKTQYVQQKHYRDGYVVSAGMMAQLRLATGIWLFAEAFAAPDKSTLHMGDYQSAVAGLELVPYEDIFIRAGYHYSVVNGLYGQKDVRFADGAFIGISYLF